LFSEAKAESVKNLYQKRGAYDSFCTQYESHRQ